MALPVNATVEAAPNFLTCLQTVQAFFVTQNVDTASARLSKLKAELREMSNILGWSPAVGRPARFLASKSVQTRMRLEAIAGLAQEAGLPYLREYVLGQHIVMYAHSDTEVVLLAIKHQRQLVYSVN